MIKLAKIAIVTILLTLLLSSCTKDKERRHHTHTHQHSHDLKYNWKRIRAISKVTSLHRPLVIGCKYNTGTIESKDTTICKDYDQWTNYDNDLGQIIIKPAVDKYGEPDIDVTFILNNEYLNLPRTINSPTTFNTVRQKTDFTYYFELEQCRYVLQMEIERPKRKNKNDPSNRVLRTFDYVVIPDRTNDENCAIDPLKTILEDQIKGGRGRD